MEDERVGIAGVIENSMVLLSRLNGVEGWIPRIVARLNNFLSAGPAENGGVGVLHFVMGYIAKNYNIPKWVSIDAKKKTILLDLNRYSKHRSLKYSAQEINMADGRFRFLITVPTDN